MTDKEASDLIEAAIAEAIKSGEDYDPNDIITDWVVVGYCVNPESEKGGRYFKLLANGLMPEYRVSGLLKYADEYLM